jgi:hypothetical protein
MTMTRRQWFLTLIVSMALFCFIAVAVELMIHVITPPADNSLVGWTETGMRASYGQPKGEFPGHYGLPPMSWVRQFKGEIKTAVFARPGGELYVSYEKRNGQWIVISNSYLPHGGAF